ncbi:hypothetical protein [Methylomonas methanica]|uniref:hypothetical protein n=1 Tax=Methylomonas methanica TaxID=421 RepID=UPI000673E3C6|nr:hypothetical protein [Methylomonas methanica]
MDTPDIAGGKAQPLPTEGTIPALNIPYSSMVFDLHHVTEIQAELLGGNGIAKEQIRHANLFSFTCLKSFAFADTFCKELARKHCDVVKAFLSILRDRFVQDEKVEGYRKDGPGLSPNSSLARQAM